MNKILAILETKDGKFKSSSLEAASEARKLSVLFNCEFSVFTVSDISDDDCSVLKDYGVNTLCKAGLTELNKISGKDIQYSYSALAKVISEFIKLNNYNIVILPATSYGKELAGKISILTDSALCPDVTEIETDNDNIIATRPVYAGKALVKVKFHTNKILLTLRPNIFKAGKNITDNLTIEKVDIKNLNVSEKDFAVTVKEVSKSSGKLDVAEADRIVSGGRGLRAPENFILIENLANVIGAATGASRAVVDAGWRPHSEQVGQTGKTVSPELYIACGISGAIQHLAGMSSAKCIVAINKDKDAPIFQTADYGIVGDVFEILPALTAEFEKLLKN